MEWGGCANLLNWPISMDFRMSRFLNNVRKRSLMNGIKYGETWRQTRNLWAQVKHYAMPITELFKFRTRLQSPTLCWIVLLNWPRCHHAMNVCVRACAGFRMPAIVFALTHSVDKYSAFIICLFTFHSFTNFLTYPSSAVFAAVAITCR